MHELGGLISLSNTIKENDPQFENLNDINSSPSRKQNALKHLIGQYQNEDNSKETAIFGGQALSPSK